MEAVSGEAQEKVVSVFDKGYEHLGNKRTHGTRLPSVESCDQLSNPTLNGKLWTLNNDDDDDDDDETYITRSNAI